MKKFTKYVAMIIVMSICLFELVVFGIILQKKDVFDSSYQSLIVDKYRMLQNTDEKKIIIISGSSSSFGLDQAMLEDATGYKVVNLGLHAAFGQLFPSELAKENINAGDIVLLSYEYNWFCDFETLGQDLVMSGIDHNIDMYKHIPIDRWPDFIGYIFKYAQKKNTYTEASGIYSREAFDQETGQMTWLRDYALPDYFDNVDTYGHITVADENGNVNISDVSVAYLLNLKKYVKERGAGIYFVSPPILYESITCQPEDFLRLAELEEEKIGIPYISDPTLYMFPADLMSDAPYHCNSEGERIRTSILINDLRLCGAVDGEYFTETVKEESGETFALVDSVPKRFLHKPQSINCVYRVDGKGNVVQYKEGTDNIVDYERGTIRRTENSAIPNYSGHHVTYAAGKFTCVNDPENINPENNKKYQVLVDYSYRVSDRELECLNNQSTYLSENVRNKILNGETITIALCGDSIGAGADTNGEGIFLNYLDETLEEQYGISVNTKQLSVGSANRTFLTENMQAIVNKRPDILMIEFGMDDHVGGEGSSEERVHSYARDIEKAVEVLQENGIDVILIGFFQQNMTWDVENMEATILYNDALRDVARRRDVYFADVYDVFYKVGSKKPLSRDVMADYIHHPTEWGHKLYFTSLIDAFNIDGHMKPVDLKYYVHVD